jgi:hypothetical protein
MTPDDLVERVARKWAEIASQNPDLFDQYTKEEKHTALSNKYLLAAIRLALEEAAKVKPEESETHYLQASGYTFGWDAALRAKAAAIRAMIKD